MLKNSALLFGMVELTRELLRWGASYVLLAKWQSDIDCVVYVPYKCLKLQVRALVAAISSSSWVYRWQKLYLPWWCVSITEEQIITRVCRTKNVLFFVYSWSWRYYYQGVFVHDRLYVNWTWGRYSGDRAPYASTRNIYAEAWTLHNVHKIRNDTWLNKYDRYK